MASARTKLPTNKTITGSAYGARTVRAGATPSAIARADASSAVSPRGSASVIQQTTAHAKIAASRCASGVQSVKR
jgi:hypothetical protein